MAGLQFGQKFGPTFPLPGRIHESSLGFAPVFQIGVERAVGLAPQQQFGQRPGVTYGKITRIGLPQQPDGPGNVGGQHGYATRQRFADHILRFPCRPWLKGQTAPVIASHSQGPLSACLSRDGIACQQAFAAFAIDLGELESAPRSFGLGLGVGQRGFERTGIDDEQEIAAIDMDARFEMHRLQITGHSCSNVHMFDRVEPAGERRPGAQGANLRCAYGDSRGLLRGARQRLEQADRRDE